MIQALLDRFPAYREVWAALDARENPIAASGLSGVHKAHLLAQISVERPLLLIAPDEQELVRLCNDIAAILGTKPTVLPPRTTAYHNVDVISHEWEHERLKVLHGLRCGNVKVLAATPDALMMVTLSPERLQGLMLQTGGTYRQEDLLTTLIVEGYRRCEQVEGIGQFAVRGGIVDFFSPSSAAPVRIEFFGNEIDSMATIDTTTQRRLDNIDEADMLPVRELLPHEDFVRQLEILAAKQKNDAVRETMLQDAQRYTENGIFPALDRYIQLLCPENATAFDYLPDNALVVIAEKERCRGRREATMWRQQQDVETLLEAGLIDAAQTVPYIDEVEWAGSLRRRDLLYLDALPSDGYEVKPRANIPLQAKQLPSYGGSLETALGDIRYYQESLMRTLVLCPTPLRCKQLEEVLRDKGIAAQVETAVKTLPAVGQVLLTVGGLSGGMEYPAGQLAVITEEQLVQLSSRKRGSSRKDSRQRVASYADLTPGDLVVHDLHGIGRFVGIEPIEVDGVRRDYIKIQYAGTDSLYVPVTQLNMVSKYIGAGAGGGDDEKASKIKLSKLGGEAWQRAKNRAKESTKELAADLIKLYAERMRKKGFAFEADSEWQKEFEEAFPYDETQDQITAIADCKNDMQSSLPMDRLLCGDVGFGKTEVALRMVMKCVLSGRQAAILVPTTVLAQQHYNTARQRFGRYPLRVEMVSRFRTAAQNRETLKKLRNGELDLVIGTHRLLQKDVIFQKLGLLVIDEEQRFGVSHKEKLKEMAKQVDVLTLTATPIPRTLNMALSGVRDMSTLEEPPRNRYPVQTFVLEYDELIIDDAIRREIGRGGQVYYLHNRVDTIEALAGRLQRRHPDAKIAVAHGKMAEGDLSEMMRLMTEGEIDLLVCTTIIETGLDIPNVNTLIIEDADKMGLAQLHQIRGRVGRSNRHASAYLTYRRGKILTEVATKRLTAVREYVEFGAGFKIAMRDLEIRGAGNILGAEQHGHMLSVGYDMYLKLLEEAVLEEKGEQKPLIAECIVDLQVNAGIDEKYVKSAGVRMDLYRRIALVRDREQARDLLDELIDRFGEPPRMTINLVDIALLRNEAAAAGFCEVTQKEGRILLYIQAPDLERVAKVCGMEKYRRKVLFSVGDKPYFAFKYDEKLSVIEQLRALIGDYVT
ncbi:MAG: transcription-repair coupling factor [Oscillospiraceae bacterium]|nr:transcription-repair coupling factor [Oscillospiraceae bacterium]